MKRVTIKQIAQEAGVSYQIVSKVLNNQGRVSEETRERILGIADELGYVPSRIARSLVSKRTKTLGFVAGDLSNYFITQFIVGAEQEARQQDHSFIVISLQNDASDPKSDLSLLMEQHVDGVLLAAPQLESSSEVETILAGKLPVVSIHPVSGDFTSIVDSDQEEIGAQAGRHLIEKGYSHIATITGTLKSRAAQLRLKGMRHVLESNRIPLPDHLIAEGNWDADSGYQATIRLLRDDPNIDAIFAQNDLMAMGVLHALNDMNYRVPDDCGVIGCDDLPTSSHAIPPLSTIRIPVYETGQRAVQVLLGKIEEESMRPSPAILLPTRIVARQSTMKGSV